MREAALLNRPPRVIDGAAADIQPPVAIESDAVSLEVLKKAEKENCLVVRLVETKGADSKAILSLRNAERAVETDLLEWTDGAAHVATNGKIELTLKPFEIRTLKLK